MGFASWSSSDGGARARVHDPPLPVDGPPEPVEGATVPADGPPPPVECPPDPVESPPVPLDGPPEPVEGPPDPVECPPEAVETPTVPADCPPEAVGSPTVPVNRPPEAVKGATVPVGRPPEAAEGLVTPVDRPLAAVKRVSICYPGVMRRVEIRDRAWEDRLQPSRESEERIFAAAQEATRFFMGKAKVQEALAKVTRLLEEDGIPYALIGALALNDYGYERVTVDVDLLLTREGLEAFKAKHLGLGYVQKFPGSKGLRDTENGVAIDFVLAGEYPGDGLPKPVVFPDPASAAVKPRRLALLPLPRLIELKLASGMTAPHRLKDLADVLEVIRILKLPAKLEDELDPYVREKYRELWQAAQTKDPE